jgi:hypothetical protein
VIAIPLALVIIGMILNSTGLAYDQPPSSQEQDPTKKLAAEKDLPEVFQSPENAIGHQAEKDWPV